MTIKKQRNTPLTVQEAQARLQEFGLTLISEHPDNRVTGKTPVKLRCSAGHIMDRIYTNVRKRGCPECKAPFGERLLYCFLRHYCPGEDDWRAKAVKGLDPEKPAARVMFDAASDSRKIAIENHSDYHHPDKSVARFEQNFSKKNRLRVDALKEARETDGHHLTGPMAGWRVGVVWFEATRMAGIKDESGTYLQIAISEFKGLADKIGLSLRTDGVEIDAGKVYAELGRTGLSRIGNQFKLISPYLGRTHIYQWRHSCGYKFKAVIYDLENTENGTGCPWCDATGYIGKWQNFLDRLKTYDYEFSGENRQSVCTEFDSVPVKCSKHPEAKVEVWTRSKWYQWLRGGEKKEAKRFPPPCEACASEYAKGMAQNAENRSESNQQKLNRRLEAFGFELVTKQPTSIRDPETKKIIPQKNTIRCLNPDCGYEWDVFVAQRLKKAETRGRMGCPKCRPLKKGPVPKG